MFKVMLVFLGSGLGGGARFLFGGWVQGLGDSRFPIGTLAVNIIGCFLIGLLNAALTERFAARDELRAALIAGVLGGYTTFSAFGLETFSLLRDGHVGTAATYVGLSVTLGLTAVWAGDRVADRWLG